MSKKFAASAFYLCFLASALLPPALLAATSTASVGVTAMVQAGCRISATSIPSADHFATFATANPAVSVTCTMATPYVIDLPGHVMDLPGRERPAAAAFERLPHIAPALIGPASAGYPSVLNFDQKMTAGSIAALMGCCQSPSLQSAAARASAHAITVVVTY